MDKISKYLIKEIRISIDQNYINRYEESFGDNLFDKLFEEIINDLLSPSLSTDDIREMKNYYVKTLRRTKDRWFTNVKKELKPDYSKSYKYILKQLQDYHEQYLKYKDDKFLITDKDLFTQTKLDAIKNWSKKDEFLISDFIYLNNLNKTSILKAYKNDLKYQIIMHIVNKYDCNIHSIITEKPKSIINKPIFGQRSKGTKNGVIVDNGNDRQLINEYNTGDLTVRTIISENFIKGIDKESDKYNMKLENWQTLDDKDSKLYNFINSRRSKLFLTTKMVIVEIEDIARFLYGSRGTKQKKLAEKRVIKLGGTRLEGEISYDHKENDVFTAGFFQKAIVTTDPYSNKRVAIFHYPEDEYKQFINKQTVKIYSDKINNFENPLSNELIFTLQQERIKCYEENKSYKIIRPYESFLYQFRFPSQNKRENLKFIEDSLDELKGVIIKNYDRINKSDFEIELIELTEYEIHDFIQQKDDNHLYISEHEYKEENILISPSSLNF
ncbi:hypothetical protein [Wukongibacter baidiensis]